MKRNLLAAAISCVLLMGLVGCDDNKLPESAPAPAAAPASPSASSGADNKEVKNASPDRIISEKMSVYIECYNDIDEDIYRSIKYYARWLDDLKVGPTGKEKSVGGITDVSAEFDKCLANMTHVSSLKPSLDPIDNLALPYINSSIKLAEVINKMNKYYEQQDYKDDAFAKGKALHTQFIQALAAFKPASDAYSEAIHEINNRRQEQQLKTIEAKEGKSFDYYSLSIMLTSKKVNQALEADKFDTDAAMKLVQDLGEQIEQLKSNQGETKKGPRMREIRAPTFIEAAEKYLLDAKTRVRRVRDNTPLTSGEAMLMDGAPQMVDGSFEHLMASYNQLVRWFNTLSD